MTKHKNDGNNEDETGFSDSDLALIRENDWTVDATGNVFDDHGNELPPGIVAAAIVVDELDVPAAKGFDGVDAMFPPAVRSEPNAMGQPALGYPPAGAPPDGFVRPGTAIDSDGVIGTPAEWNAQRPRVDQRTDTGLDDSGTLAEVGTTAPSPRTDDFAAIGLDATPQAAAAARQAAARQPAAPPGSPAATLTQAQAQGDRLMSTAAARGEGMLTPRGIVVSRPNGRPDPSAHPAITVLDQSQIKGASL